MPFNSRSRLFYIFVFLALVGAFLGCAYYAYCSHKLPKFAIERALKAVSLRQGAKIDLKGLSGSIKEGFVFDELIIHKPSSFKLSAKGCMLGFNYSAAAQGKIGLVCAVKSLKYIRHGAMPSVVKKLATQPRIGCFSAAFDNLTIYKLKIDSAEFVPWHDCKLAIRASNLLLTPSGQRGKSDVSAAVNAVFNKTSFADGSLKGAAYLSEKKLSGQAELNLFGQRLVSDVSIENKKGINEISGYIAKANADITPIASKLAFLWQDWLPIGLNGRLSINGAWLYNEKTGFLGNLSGKINKLNITLPGLFLTLLEINGSWKYFDDTLQITDNGTAFMGIKAKLNGKIENLSSKKRMNYLDLSCEKIDIESLLNSLPWAVKYSLALPKACRGYAELLVKVRSAEPRFFCRLMLDKAEMTENEISKTVSGRVCAECSSLKKWHLNGALRCAFSALPPFLGSFSGKDGTLFDYCALRGKKNVGGNISYRFSGPSLSSLDVSGSFINGAVSGDIAAQWAGSYGQMSLTTNKNAVFNKNGVSLIDLLFCRQ